MNIPARALARLICRQDTARRQEAARSELAERRALRALPPPRKEPAGGSRRAPCCFNTHAVYECQPQPTPRRQPPPDPLTRCFPSRGSRVRVSSPAPHPRGPPRRPRCHREPSHTALRAAVGGLSTRRKRAAAAARTRPENKTPSPLDMQAARVR